MNRSLRPLQSQDREQWERLWNGYLAFYKTSLDATQTDRTWQRLCDSQFNLYGLVVLQGQTVIGITHYLFHPSTSTKDEYCYLQDLFVSPEYRSQGVARQLIAAVTEAAKARPAQRVYWLTHESNATARVLYDKVATSTGFIQYRIAPL